MANNEHLWHPEIFLPEKTWTEFDLAKKNESVARVKARYAELAEDAKNEFIARIQSKYGFSLGSVAEWALHRRHILNRGIKNRTQKRQASIVTPYIETICRRIGG